MSTQLLVDLFCLYVAHHHLSRFIQPLDRHDFSLSIILICCYPLLLQRPISCSRRHFKFWIKGFSVLQDVILKLWNIPFCPVDASLGITLKYIFRVLTLSRSIEGRIRALNFEILSETRYVLAQNSHISERFLTFAWPICDSFSHPTITLWLYYSASDSDNLCKY